MTLGYSGVGDMMLHPFPYSRHAVPYSVRTAKRQRRRTEGYEEVRVGYYQRSVGGFDHDAPKGTCLYGARRLLRTRRYGNDV